jgi:hypothetical protein
MTADVRAALERRVPTSIVALVKALADGDVARVNYEKERRPGLSIVLIRDYGALLKTTGEGRAPV